MDHSLGELRTCDQAASARGDDARDEMVRRLARRQEGWKCLEM